MPLYVFQGKNNPRSWDARVYNRRKGRGELLDKVWKTLGAKIIADYFTFGEYDFLIVLELPDNASAAALSRAMVASGMLTEDPRVTPILTMEEHRQSLEKAAGFRYPPPWPE